MAIRTLSEDGAERVTKPTVANALIVAGKGAPVRIGGDPLPPNPHLEC